MARAEAERILGSPVREFTSSGTVYRVYDYYAGDPPSAGTAATCIFLDVITLGAWELMAFILDTPLNPKREQTAVAYDTNEKVIGVSDHFGDFDSLPAEPARLP